MMMGLEFEPRTGDWDLVVGITGGVGVVEMDGVVLGMGVDWSGLVRFVRL
jgi:hypothetical protein